jgi:hypothetical protein
MHTVLPSSRNRSNWQSWLARDTLQRSYSGPSPRIAIPNQVLEISPILIFSSGILALLYFSSGEPLSNSGSSARGISNLQVNILYMQPQLLLYFFKLMEIYLDVNLPYLVAMHIRKPLPSLRVDVLWI